jgi:hypothetical protein
MFADKEAIRGVFIITHFCILSIAHAKMVIKQIKTILSNKENKSQNSLKKTILVVQYMM